MAVDKVPRIWSLVAALKEGILYIIVVVTLRMFSFPDRLKIDTTNRQHEGCIVSCLSACGTASVSANMCRRGGQRQDWHCGCGNQRKGEILFLFNDTYCTYWMPKIDKLILIHRFICSQHYSQVRWLSAYLQFTEMPLFWHFSNI